jgi:hypothetical protein
MNFRNTVVSACALLAMLSTPAQARQPDADLVHQQAVSEMLATTRLLEMNLNSLRLAASRPGPNQEFLQVMSQRISAAEAMKIHAGVICPMLNTADARWITQAYLSPAGRKALVYQAEVERAGPNAGTMVKRTSKEYAAIKAFYDMPAVRRFTELRKQASRASQEAMSVWMNRQQEEMFQSAVHEMDKHYDKFDQHGALPPTRFNPATVGISYVDQWTALLSDAQFRRVSSQWRYFTDMETLGYVSVIAPETLASRERVAASLASMDQIDRQTELFMVEREKNLEAYYDAALKIEADRKRDGANLVAEMRHQQRMQAQFAAAKWASLATTRRILEFARTSRGKLEADSGRLMLSDQHDLATYNGFVEQLRRETQDVNEAIGHLNTRRTSWL